MATNNGNGNRTESYQKAINKATGKGDGEATQETDQAPLQKGASAMIRTGLTKADLADFLMEDGYEYAPQVHTMEMYERVDGILEGNGPQAELSKIDPMTKIADVQIVDTWIIREPKGGQRISILDTVQLRKKLPPFIGQMVNIVRGDDVKTTGGFKTTNYMVRGPELPNGAVRSFVVPRVKVIDAKSIETPSAPQLAAPAGGEDAQA